MGWLYMRSLGPHAGPREYLDAQFTFDRPDCRYRVLRSSLLRLRTYYAAVERLRDTGCLVRYNPRDRDGYVFGYKDMAETMGPVESECPELILDLLTPTDSPYALAWRERCRARGRTRREASARRPRPGQTLAFEVPLEAPTATGQTEASAGRDNQDPLANRRIGSRNAAKRERQVGSSTREVRFSGHSQLIRLRYATP